MRDIRFRAWDTITNTMVNWEEFANNTQSLYHLLDSKKQTNLTLMQYTGLKDKNGKEIYQGDIIKVSKWIAQVIYGNYGWTITPNRTNQRNEVVLFNLHTILEVVGNIYENLEEILKQYPEGVSND
jgi:uncharacterized phage protein (TIGR01671 family)